MFGHLEDMTVQIFYTQTLLMNYALIQRLGVTKARCNLSELL